MTTFGRLDVVSSHLYVRYMSRQYGLILYMKVVGSRSRSQEENGRKSLFPRRKTSNGQNSRSIKHRTIRCPCIMRFSATADRMVWPPSSSRDRKWPRLTKCTHSRVAGLRLEGNLVYKDFTVRCNSFVSLLISCLSKLNSDDYNGHALSFTTACSWVVLHWCAAVFIDDDVTGQ